MSDTNETSSSPARTILRLPRELLYTAQLALDCFAYWSSDRQFRSSEGGPVEPYSENSATRTAVARAVHLQEHVETTLQYVTNEGPLTLETLDRALLEEALTELLDREELRNDDIASESTIETLARMIKAVVS